ncbi:MAG: glycosyltransferase family 2 protein, partial [Armatimonadetes bacterium]|nr:glycosyltransferase family 2 protein [Armatimonadota bacterium]
MENKQLKISIITVCYNERKENITLTFNSISSQSYRNIEWIVIDGGSKPETIDAINTYSDRIDKFVSEPDRGIYDAMNKGLSIASGDFVIFMNVGDRLYCNETIDRAVDCILANPTYDCYYGDTIRVNTKGNVEEMNRAVPKLNRFWLYKEGICHQSIFSSRQLYERTGYFDTKYQ